MTDRLLSINTLKVETTPAEVNVMEQSGIKVVYGS